MGACSAVVVDSATTANRFTIYQRTNNPLDGFDIVGRLDNFGGSNFYVIYLRNGTRTLPANFPTTLGCTGGTNNRIYFQSITGSNNFSSRGGSGGGARGMSGSAVVVEGSLDSVNSLLSIFTNADGGFGITGLRATQNCNSCAGDITAPTFNACPANTTVDIAPNTPLYCFVPSIPTATDNCSPYASLTSSVILTSYCLQDGQSQSISHIATDPNGNSRTCTYTITARRPTTGGADMAISLNSTPSVILQPYSTSMLRIAAQNIGTQAFNNVKIIIPFGTRIVTGGTARPSVGAWQEWCAGGVPCYEWTIPSLVVGATATLDVPVFIGSLAPPAFSITANLQSSTPVDGNTGNNAATLTIGAISLNPNERSLKNKPSQLVPVVIQAINPSLTEGDISVEIESLVEKSVRFDIYSVQGKVLKSEKRSVSKGLNVLPFEIYDLPQGVYFIQTDVGIGRGVPIRFVKL
jgi:hypothetical protein